jgi:hypothetical protein
MRHATELDGQEPSTNEKASGSMPEAARVIGSVKTRSKQEGLWLDARGR